MIGIKILITATVVALAGAQTREYVPNSYIFVYSSTAGSGQAGAKTFEITKASTVASVQQVLHSPDDIKMHFNIGDYAGFVVHGLQASDMKKLSADLNKTGTFYPNEIYTFNLPRGTNVTKPTAVKAAAACTNATCCKRTVSSSYNLNLDMLDKVKDGVYCAPVDVANKMNVFMLDTGVDASHPEFIGTNGVVRATAYADCNVDGLRPWTPNVDVNGHGTHTSGTVGSNSFGVTPNVNITAIKILGDDGSGTSGSLLCGFNLVQTWLQANPTKHAIMSMSVGFGGVVSSMDTAVSTLATAFQNQLIVTVASGNSGRDARQYTFGRSTNVIVVGSLSSTLAESSFSNYGPSVSITSPGENVLSTYPQAQYAIMSGTSMATPMVAGALAQYWLDNPTKTGLEIRNSIASTASPLFTALPTAPQKHKSVPATPNKRIQYTCVSVCA